MHLLLEKYFELFWNFLQFLARLIGPKLTIKLCSFLGTFASYLFPRERQICLAQLKLPQVKDKIKDDPNDIIKKNFSHVGESVGEVLYINSIFKPSERGHAKSVPGISHENLTENLEMIKKGAMALSGHFGSIELLAAYHVQMGMPLYVIARSPNYSSASTVLNNIRNNYGANTVWREDSSTLRQLSKALKSGALIAALIDQDTALESKFSTFFGLDAAYPIAPIKLAVKYKIPIFTTFIYRMRRFRHHIANTEIIYDPEDPNVIQNILDIYNERLEKMILAYPEQWIWWHKRWRRRPNVTELLSTDNYINWLNQANSRS